MTANRVGQTKAPKSSRYKPTATEKTMSKKCTHLDSVREVSPNTQGYEVRRGTKGKESVLQV
jgi:hypothetical protein